MNPNQKPNEEKAVTVAGESASLADSVSSSGMDMPQGIEARMDAFKIATDALRKIDPLDAELVVRAIATCYGL